ncbi:hypothetical protein [Cupriavidus basilensis]|uniref:Uncharacterized protein n=1 Tax=Cupriavidus basilensis TaxID=68895 RepID=A0A7M2H447_9BURK|nr:hypothetical protein [Cupriavidus basilensis]QOT79844.1 hypothetical protein F7R26_034855 [Cupriavidus basilensis]
MGASRVRHRRSWLPAALIAPLAVGLMGAHIDAEITRWSKVVKDSGARLE